MQSLINPLLIGLSFLIASAAQAVNNTPLMHNPLEHRQTGKSTQQFKRQQWDLTKKEWTRYEELMQGIRGSISPNTISPIEVLGTHARTDQERQKYARIWAKMMHDDITKILAFQSAYTEAWHTLYPNGNIIDPSKLNLKSHQNESFQAGDRILAFIKTQDCSLCQSTLRRLQKETQGNQVQLDIFFLDTAEKKEDSRIRQWAKELPIDKNRIKQGLITLNHDNGTLFSLTGQVAITNKPLLYRIRNQAIQAINR